MDGAYYRQVMLKELTGADVIFVARPINHCWLSATDGDPQREAELPRTYAEIQDLKTEVNFNGSYTGERAQIELINGLVRQRDRAAEGGRGAARCCATTATSPWSRSRSPCSAATSTTSSRARRSSTRRPRTSRAGWRRLRCGRYFRRGRRLGERPRQPACYLGAYSSGRMRFEETHSFHSGPWPA